MSIIKKICLFSNEYPTKTDPVYSFVEQLCIGFAKRGIHVTVISPQSITSSLFHRTEIHPKYTVTMYDSGGSITVYQPFCISLPFRFRKINDWLFYKSAKKVIRNIGNDFDVVYSHFWRPGYIAYKIFKEKIPLFVATGESNIANMFDFNQKITDFSRSVNGVIAVSSKNKKESISLKLAIEENIGVFPNAINNKIFFKRDKIETRKKLNISSDLFIVAFVGWFNQRKGSLRVSNAIQSLHDDIYSFFIGTGDDEPKCDKILFKGRLSHEDIPLYLSAADVFVLPTLNEGCCNAVIEAMACGLPIISSKLDFNYDVLDQSNSIMVDPNNIDDLAEAIYKVKHDFNLRNKLAEGSLLKARSLTISQRVDNILAFMNEKIINN